MHTPNEALPRQLQDIDRDDLIKSLESNSKDESSTKPEHTFALTEKANLLKALSKPIKITVEKEPTTP